jgi:hypothetical protein
VGNEAEQMVDAQREAVRQIQDQYQRQFQQLLATELHLVRVACQPTREDFQRIAADGDRFVAEVIREVAVGQNAPRNLIMVNGVWNARPRGDVDPREKLAERLAESVEKHLSSDQAGRYASELSRREEALARLVVLNIVAKLDKQFLLNGQQREQIAKVLEENWNDSWKQLQFHLHDDNYFPPLPEQQLLPLLTATQRTVWQGTYQGANVRFGLDFNFVAGIDVGAEQWEE